jgi:hypothetical protein
MLNRSGGFPVLSWFAQIASIRAINGKKLKLDANFIDRATASHKVSNCIQEWHKALV